jgi:hypothetical protein
MLMRGQKYKTRESSAFRIRHDGGFRCFGFRVSSFASGKATLNRTLNLERARWHPGSQDASGDIHVSLDSSAPCWNDEIDNAGETGVGITE